MNRASAPALRVPALRVAAFAIVAVVAACTDGLVATPASVPASSGARASATAQAPASFGPPPSPSPPDDAAPLTLDRALLDFLPTEVAGIKVSEDLDVASEAFGNATLPLIATAVDAAVAVDAANGNLVSAWVLRLRSSNFTEASYRQWRDSYDEGACAAAGGVVGRAEATIADRNVYVTSCVTGLLDYHVWLQEQGILISASSIGDGRFGEHLLEGLRVPTATPATQ